MLVCSVLALILGLCVGSPNHSRRLVCWKAMLKCHSEPECHYAYEQYMHACASVFTGERRKCPSHCISSLVQLNLTQSGPALEDCDCAMDPVCRGVKQAIEPCLPRTSTMGCTEAREQCEGDLPCRSALGEYLFHCRKLFGGERCTDECRRVIANMRKIPKAQQLDTCVCDGAERNICEYIKASMKTFCSDSEDGFPGSGYLESEEDLDNYDYPIVESSNDSPPCRTALSVLTTILVFTSFI